MSAVVATPGQTIGPFYGFALPYDAGNRLAPAGDPRTVRLRGLVLDGEGRPVPDAMLEIWQADPAGQVPRRAGSLRRDGVAFTGWGRAATTSAGAYEFLTLPPGPVDGGTPFIAMTVLARGLLNRLFTRVYLPSTDRTADPLLARLDPARGDTLVAREEDGDLVFDVRLQGEGETVFLRYAGQAP